MLDLVLALHVAAGAVGLVAGPVAWTARRRRRRHTRAGWTYQACVAVLCSSSLVLVSADPSLWPFALIAVATQAAAAGAVVVRRRRRPGWLPQHVQLVLGSYVSFVTAFAVQAVGGLWAWVVPSTVGTVAVAVATTRVAQRTAASASGRVKAPA